MRAKSIIGLAAGCVVACLGLFASFTGAALATATGGPAAGFVFPPQGGLTLPPPPPPGSPRKGYVVVGSCPSFLFTTDMSNPSLLSFEWTDGSLHFYGPQTGTSSGLNVQGDAMLLLAGQPTGYAGQTHIWTGGGVNPNNNGSGTGNQQNYFGATISTHLTNGTNSIQVNGAFGGGNSASGNPTGWSETKVTCS